MGPGARIVGAHREDFPLDVGATMIEIDGARRDRERDVLPETAEGPVAVVLIGADFKRRERTVFFRSRLDVMRQRRSVVRIETLFLPGEPDFDRTARLAGPEGAPKPPTPPG